MQIGSSIGLWMSLLLCVVFVSITVSCSPPVDFLQYTTDEIFNHRSESVLLEPIYRNSGNHEDRAAHLDRLMSRVQSLVQQSNHSHDSSNIDLEAAQLAWHLMEKQAYLYMLNRVSEISPFVQELLLEAQVSVGCSSAVANWLKRLAQLDKWAVVMWNSWGEMPPVGVFEGSFTDLGSYSGCLNAEVGADIGEPQYCTLDYQPLVPARPRFHSIFKRVLDVDANSKLITGGDFDSTHSNAGENETRRTSHSFTSFKFRQPKPISSDDKKAGWSLSSSMMTELARRAQFFYYTRLRIGTCWPSKCSRDEIHNVSRSAASRALLRATDTYCVSPKKESKFNTYQVVAIIILVTLASITILVSLVELLVDFLRFLEYEDLADNISDGCMTNIIDIWSIKPNLHRILSTDPKVPVARLDSSASENGIKQQQVKSPAQLTCLHGLKTLSVVWIINGHTLLNLDYHSITHVFDTLDTKLINLFVLPFLNANFSVDTFFLISGLLSVYVIFSMDLKFNGFLFTLARYTRLTPQLVIVILMFFMLPTLGDGPIYKQYIDVYTNRCYKNFWLNLFYLQSYVNVDERCVLSSWWLSIEMTFHFLSLIVIYMLMKNPKLGMLTNLGLISTLTLIGSYIHYTNGFAIQYLPSIPQRYEVELEQTQLFFHRPYPHAASYFIGVGLGYLIARRSVKKLSSKQLMLGWSVFGLGLGVSLFGTYYWNQGAAYTQLQATLYYNLCQILWPMSIGWLILACSLGYGGFINELLSANFFVPFSRITYMTYLSHMVIVYYHAASLRRTFEPNPSNLINLCICNTLLSLIFGALCSLVYESPMMNIQRILLGKISRRYSPCRLIKSREITTTGAHLVIEG